MIRKAILLIIATISIITASGQAVYQPYFFDFNKKMGDSIYDPHTRVHSSIKPYFINDSVLTLPNTAIRDSRRQSFIKSKLFKEHLLEVNKEQYTFFADFLPDFMIGKEASDGKTLWLNTRGYQFGGTVNKNFYFYTSGYENQARFPRYYQDYTNRTNIVPGQSYDRAPASDIKDWSYVTALLSYTPIKYLNITLGQDKTFIGDGYRSMILSDFASNYPFLKLTGTLGNVRYMAMWAAFQDPSATKFSYDAGNRKKGGVFHYLDWNVNNRLSLGFFDAVVWSQYDDLEHKRGFDWQYINPVIFLRPLEAMSGSPDNALIGFTAKYELLNSLAFYGQFCLDEFSAKDFLSNTGSYRNKWGLQIGARGNNPLGITNLNYLLEYNTARPYTYSERTPVINYAHYNEPLAHPFGANFRELVGILSYTYQNFEFLWKSSIARYGLDNGTINNGKNIFKPYTQVSRTEGNVIGQGEKTNFYFNEAKISYILNPSYNLRLEVGGQLRDETNSTMNSHSSIVFFGLRSSFRNLYADF